MNERIRQLADEAAKFSAILTLPTGESGDKLFVEKFAQLIVKECAGFRNELGVALCTDPSALHRYFGVEE